MITNSPTPTMKIRGTTHKIHMREPRVILYCEYYKFLNGFLFRKSGMGFITSYHNQIKALKTQNIFFTEDLRSDANIFQADTQGLRTLWLVKKIKKRGRKIIIYAHATAEELYGGFRIFSLLAGLYRRYLSYIYSLADAVACPSIYTANLLRDKYGIPKKKTIFISNGVDIHSYAFNPKKREYFRKEYNITSDEIVILNVAMVIKKKGIDTFIALAESFPDVRFIWCGKIFSRLFAPKIPTHPSNVNFYGYVDDIIAAYSAADIFLFPSHEENQGISVLEAGTIGLPVLLRDIPVYSVWLADGENCLKARDNEEFKNKLSLLIKSKELRKTLGENLRQLIRKEHSLEAIGQKLKNLYLTLLQNQAQ